MNKSVVDKSIPYAYEALEQKGIAKDGKVSSRFRSQVSSLGSAIATGSLKATVAFFSNQGSATVERQRLNDAILYVLQKTGYADQGMKKLWDYVEDCTPAQEKGCKENIINAAIALKLAMNLYQLVD